MKNCPCQSRLSADPESTEKLVKTQKINKHLIWRGKYIEFEGKTCQNVENKQTLGLIDAWREKSRL